MHRRAGRAFGALSVVAFAAFGQTGPALAVGTVAQTEPVSSLSVTPFGPYAEAEVAGPTAVAAATPTLPMATATSTPAAPPLPPRRPADGRRRQRHPEHGARRLQGRRAAANPSCHLPWTLIAGIGRVESGNAAGGRVDTAGTTHGRILGPRLDGATVGAAMIRDTDGGALDGDTAFDRAVGPMQFIPGTWKTFAKDGNNDGVASPHNVFDAAAAAANFLCAGGGDLSQPAAQRAALLRYNRSDAYGALVLRWAAAYGAGVSVIPDGTGPVPNTLPTPPAQVPAPASGALDPAAAAALAAPAPAVSGPVASASDADTVVTTTVTATTPTSTSTSSTPTSTTTKPTTTTPTSTTPAPVTTTTTPSTTTTTTPTTTSTTTSPSTTTSTTTTTKVEEPVVTSSSSESSTTESSTTESSTRLEQQSRAARRRAGRRRAARRRAVRRSDTDSPSSRQLRQLATAPTADPTRFP